MRPQQVIGIMGTTCSLSASATTARPRSTAAKSSGIVSNHSLVYGADFGNFCLFYDADFGKKPKSYDADFGN